MTIRGLARLLLILGGKVAANFRKVVEDTFGRVINGDQTLIQEINSNAESQAPLQQAYRAAMAQEPDSPNTLRKPLNKRANMEMDIDTIEETTTQLVKYKKVVGDTNEALVVFVKYAPEARQQRELDVEQALLIAEKVRLDKAKDAEQQLLIAEKARLDKAKDAEQADKAAKLQLENAEKARLEKAKDAEQARLDSELDAKKKIEIDTMLAEHARKLSKDNAEHAERTRLEKEAAEQRQKTKDAEQELLDIEKKAELQLRIAEKAEEQQRTHAERARLDVEADEEQRRTHAERARLDKEAAEQQQQQLSQDSDTPLITIRSVGMQNGLFEGLSTHDRQAVESTAGRQYAVEYRATGGVENRCQENNIWVCGYPETSRDGIIAIVQTAVHAHGPPGPLTIAQFKARVPRAIKKLIEVQHVLIEAERMAIEDILQRPDGRVLAKRHGVQTFAETDRQLLNRCVDLASAKFTGANRSAFDAFRPSQQAPNASQQAPSAI